MEYHPRSVPRGEEDNCLESSWIEGGRLESCQSTEGRQSSEGCKSREALEEIATHSPNKEIDLNIANHRIHVFLFLFLLTIILTLTTCYISVCVSFYDFFSFI